MLLLARRGTKNYKANICTDLGRANNIKMYLMKVKASFQELTIADYLLCLLKKKWIEKKTLGSPILRSRNKTISWCSLVQLLGGHYFGGLILNLPLWGPAACSMPCSNSEWDYKIARRWGLHLEPFGWLSMYWTIVETFPYLPYPFESGLFATSSMLLWATGRGWKRFTCLSTSHILLRCSFLPPNYLEFECLLETLCRKEGIEPSLWDPPDPSRIIKSLLSFILPLYPHLGTC